MQTRFDVLLGMLAEAFDAGVADDDYHDIVSCLRAYQGRPGSLEEEQRVLLA
jgi:hypothetical protein